MALTRPRAYQIYDIDYKQAVRVVTISNITLSGGAPNQVDGVNLSLKDRVLVTGQTNPVQNGIYYVTTLGAGSNGTWTRSIDTDQTGELLSGTIVMVTEGLTYADTQWKLTTNDPITIGVSSLTFVQNYLANSISYGQTSFAIGTANANATVSVSGTGNVAVFAPTGEYVTGEISASGNITSAGNVSGTYLLGNVFYATGISANKIYNGTTEIAIGASGGNANISVGGTSNIAVFATTGEYVTGLISATGNITGNYILGNGSQLTGLPATYSDANVSAYLASGTDTANIITSANITGGNLIAVDVVYGQYIAASLGVFGYSFEGGVVSATGDITGGNLLTGGNISATGNITSSGNVSGTYLLGNVFYATGMTANKIYNGTTEVAIGASGGNANISVGGTSNVVVVYSGGMSVTGDLTVTGNATLSGNIIGDRIVNGTTELAIQTASGNANLTIGGVSNVVVWSTAGEYINGLISASGNITSAGNISGGNILGNGRNLTGINSFSTISVSGQDDVVADSTNDTLTLVAGTNIAITTNAGSDTITISYGGSSSIFGTGGTMGTITESVTSSEDLGTITDAVTGTTYDLGSIAVDGVVTNENIAFYTITGDKLSNNLVYSSNLSVTGTVFGNVTGALSTSATTPPSSPTVGDIWYDTSTDVMYRYTFDGTSSYWVDQYGPTVGTSGYTGGYYLANGATNITTVYNGNANVTVNGTSNVAVFTANGLNVTNLSASGNITGSNILFGSGSVSGTGTITTSGDLIGGNITITNTFSPASLSTTGNVSLGITNNLLNINYNTTSGVANIGANSTGGNTSIIFGTSNAGTFANRITIDNTGNLTPLANASQDLGSTTFRWRSIYTSDLDLNNGIGDWTIVEGEDDLFLYNNKRGKTYKFALIEVDPNAAPPKINDLKK